VSLQWDVGYFSQKFENAPETMLYSALLKDFSVSSYEIQYGRPASTQAVLLEPQTVDFLANTQ